MNFFQLESFTNFGHQNPGIINRLCIDLKCWIRICIETSFNADPHPCFQDTEIVVIGFFVFSLHNPIEGQNINVSHTPL